LPTSGQRNGMSSSYLFENGTIVDGTGAPPRPGAVLVENDTIAAIGDDAARRATQAAKGVTRVDARGMTVMPGLIDAHVHLSFDDAQSNAEIFYHRRNALSALVAAYNARKVMRAGVTSILDPDSVYECMVDVRDAVESGVIDGPRIACGAYALMTSVGGTAGRLIPDHGVIGWGKVLKDKDEIVAEVRRQIKNGVDWIKVHVTGLIPRQKHKGELSVWTPDELALLCGVAHDLGTPVVGHCRGARSVRDAANAGFDLIYHATGMDDEALAAVIDKRVPIAPTLTYQANMADYGEAVGADAGLREFFRSEISDSAESLKRAYAAGVPLLCGSESGFSMVPYGEWHYREMEVFTTYLGLTPLQAIQCATQAGAFALRMDGRIGVLAPGYLADVICVQGDPSKDVTELGQPDAVKHVMIGGRMMDISPPAARKSISGWRYASMGGQLTRERAFARHEDGGPKR
jgi:imidazolonepropionase-like amidohydrolase